MLRRIITSTLILTLFGGFLLAFSPTASAVDNSVQERFCQGVNTLELPPDTTAQTDDGSAGTCQASAAGTNTSANRIIKNIINIFSLIVGLVAVIMMIYGGFRYITSGGDSGNVTSAKNTILYAIVGLVIVALAQFIVRFVIGKATGAGGEAGTT